MARRKSTINKNDSTNKDTKKSSKKKDTTKKDTTKKDTTRKSVKSDDPGSIKNKMMESQGEKKTKPIESKGKTTSSKKNEIKILKFEILCRGSSNYPIDYECRRVAELREDQTFEDLHLAIQEYFEFDDDHLYSFSLDNNVYDTKNSIGPKEADMESIAEHTTIGEKLKKESAFEYLFDFGEEWLFSINVIDIRKELISSRKKYPILIEESGKSPDQYSNFDEESEDEDYDEDEDWEENDDVWDDGDEDWDDYEDDDDRYR